MPRSFLSGLTGTPHTHKNHGPDFHACVAAVLPDHKARRALLKR
ncbi:MAG: M48 family metallopeptidase [Butyricicoccus sp.]|nr:M48 family metallopeptidase [Butyricicoccus sp.]MBQ8585323.1 M48 family metallopeptidase [Butyricicoccus sp.]